MWLAGQASRLAGGMESSVTARAVSTSTRPWVRVWASGEQLGRSKV